MKENMNEKMTCENCRYFSRHFVKNDGGTFMPINCGHCICRDMDKIIAKRTFQRRLDCAKWEPREMQIQKRREAILRNLEFMEEHLRQIAIILQDDRAYLYGTQDLVSIEDI